MGENKRRDKVEARESRRKGGRDEVGERKEIEGESKKIGKRK